VETVREGYDDDNDAQQKEPEQVIPRYGERRDKKKKKKRGKEKHESLKARIEMT
jgi:hypothetical protein